VGNVDDIHHPPDHGHAHGHERIEPSLEQAIDNDLCEHWFSSIQGLGRKKRKDETLDLLITKKM
jgi:hypothetical protein